MSRAHDSYVDSWMLALHDKAPRTRSEYRRIVTDFAGWLHTHRHIDDLLDATRQDIEAWFTATTDVTQQTRRNRWIALRSFYGWLADEDEIDRNPMAKVKVAKPVDPPPPVIPLPDLRRLLKACEGRDFAARRDTAIVRTFLATGARLHELTMLQVPDIDLDARLARIMGKGSKLRVVRFDAATAAALDRYRRARGRRRQADRPWFWLGHRGRLTDRGVSKALERRANAAGLVGFHPHLLRHTWADLWKSRGGSEGDLMRLGGWEDASVMRRYGEARAVDRALAAYDDIDPLAEL